MQTQINAIINQVISTITYAFNWGIKVSIIVTAALLVVSIISYLFSASKQ